jgi:hypothetical protein
VSGLAALLVALTQLAETIPAQLPHATHLVVGGHRVGHVLDGEEHHEHRHDDSFVRNPRHKHTERDGCRAEQKAGNVKYSEATAVFRRHGKRLAQVNELDVHRHDPVLVEELSTLDELYLRW